MHKTVAEAEAFVALLLPELSSLADVEAAVCPSFLALAAVADAARGSRLEVYAQNMHYAREGAFTGEVSPAMLAETGVRGTILGHSERRELFAESDRALQLKVPAAL